MCSASGKRSSSSSCTSRWPANTTSGSSEARKSSIHASAALALPRAASRLSALSCARPLGAQRRGHLRLELAEVQRLLAQPGDHVVLGEPVLALVVERHREHDLALGRAAAAARRPSAGARSRSGAGASGCAPPPRRPGSGGRSARPSRTPRRRPRIRSWAISSSGWFITGVPVSASCSAPRAAPRPAAARPACAWRAGS